jgi:hypothetical protein
VKLSPEDLDKLRVKQVANIIRKLNAGKTLTAREEALLAQARTGGSATAPSAFAQTWDDLAQRLGVSRKSLQNWRERPDLIGLLPRPRADGRHDVTAWAKAMVDHGLARADEDLVDENAIGAPKSVRDWKAYREELTCREIERRIARGDGKLLVASDIEVALGQFLAGISTALTHLPGSAARFLVGIRDIHVVQAKLQSEIDTILLRLNAARFLEEQLIAEVVGEIALEGQDATAIAGCVREVLRRMGRRALPGEAAESLPAQCAPEHSEEAEEPVPPAPPQKRKPKKSPVKSAKLTANRKRVPAKRRRK